MTFVHLLFLPLLFSHWVGPLLLTGYISFITLLIVLFKLIIHKVKIDRLSVIVLSVILLFFLINFSHILNGQKMALVYQNVYVYLNIFILFIIMSVAKPWTSRELKLLAKIIFYVAFFSIFLEFIASNFFNISQEIIPTYKSSKSYSAPFMGFFRPFGLTGQPTINGGVLLISFLLIYDMKINKYHHYILLVVGSILTISGQVYFCLLFVLILILFSRFKFRAIRWMFYLICFLGILLVASYELFPKFSLKYLVYTLITQARVEETLGHLNTWQLLFGTLGTESKATLRGSEVFFVESIRVHGAVFTASFWIFIWVIIRKSYNKWLLFGAIFTSSLHYPSVFFVEFQLPLILVYLNSQFSNKESTKINTKFKEYS